MTQLRRRVETAYLDKAHALPLALVLQHPHELADAGVADAACQVVVALHTLHVQVLNTDGTHLAFVRQLVGNLVKIVSTAACDALVQSCYPLLHAAVGTAAFRLLRQPALQQLQLAGLLSGKMRTLELPAVGKHGEGFQSCVDADSGLLVARGWLRRGHNAVVDQHACIVFARGGTADGDGLYLATEASVQNGGDALRLGDADGAVLEVNAAMLRALEALSVMLALELWETGRATEEIVIGSAEIADAHLERLRVDLAEPFLLRFQLSLHAVDECIGADALPMLLVSRGLHVERPVPYDADASEGLGQQHLLLLCRVDSVFVRSLHSHSLMETGKAAAVPSLSQLHNATGYMREAAALCFILSASAKKTSLNVFVRRGSCCSQLHRLIVVTLQRYEDNFECPNISTIISYIGMENLKTYGLTTGISVKEPSAGGVPFLLGRTQYLLGKKLFRVFCRQRQSGNDSALHREPRLKSCKKVFTPRHSFTRLKTAWISGAYF